MGNFNQLAKSLIAEKAVKSPDSESRSGITEELEAAGFGRSDVIQEYRNLYDSADEVRDKRQILDKVAEMHGLTEPENTKQVPKIVINVGGDNNRMAIMLNPSVASGEAVG
jgi:hypothetical protein